MRRCAVVSRFIFAAGLAAVASPSYLGRASASEAQVGAAYVPTMTFDVASVRESKDLDPAAGITMSGDFDAHTAIFRVINWSIGDLIGTAYGVDQSEIIGLPQWPFPTLFVVNAKGDPADVAKLATLTAAQQQAEQEHMVRALLEDRFALKTHWETRESDVYHLVVAKGGPKLVKQGRMPPSPEELKNFDAHPIPSLYQRNDGHGYDFVAHGCSMENLVGALTGQFGRKVINLTGLTGTYDFVLKYKGRWDLDRPADDPDPLPPLDRGLTEELGLKIEKAKGPVTVLVIDHVEMPSPN